MTYNENIKAILECTFAGFKEEIIDIACNRILELEQGPKTGHWILTSDDDYEHCTCSECGFENGENWMIGSNIKFCQECGAKMQEAGE